MISHTSANTARPMGLSVQKICLDRYTVQKGALIRVDCLDEVKSRVEPFGVSVEIFSESESESREPCLRMECGDTDSEEEAPRTEMGVYSMIGICAIVSAMTMGLF